MRKETKPFIKVIIKPNKKSNQLPSPSSSVAPAREIKPKSCKTKLPKRWIRL